MMLLELGTFFFVLLGSKLLAGAVVVYLMLPRDSCCAICDADLLPIEHPRGSRRLMRWCRLQRHWCMECHRESLTRPRRRSTPPPVALRPVAESRLR
jgi:hypothetical protein